MTLPLPPLHPETFSQIHLRIIWFPEIMNPPLMSSFSHYSKTKFLFSVVNGLTYPSIMSFFRNDSNLYILAVSWTNIYNFPENKTPKVIFWYRGIDADRIARISWAREVSGDVEIFARFQSVLLHVRNSPFFFLRQSIRTSVIRWK